MSEHNLPIRVLEHKQDGLEAIQLTEEPYSGIIYSYGKVRLDPDEATQTLKIAFEYHIYDMASKVITDPKPFEDYIGKILQELIQLGVEENSITYTGGVDENRTTDSVESNS